VIYQHPLAYLLGLEGAALMLAFNGGYDREFTQARLAEVRAMLDSPGQFGDGQVIRPVSAAEGYDIWAERYDQPGNALIDIEQPVVQAIVGQFPPGTALDAACGTGRHSQYLASLGHAVTGVDASRRMLAAARAKVPGADFRTGDLCQLPVPDGHADLVVCSLALTHIPHLGPAFAEFARVLKPGGHLVTSDSANPQLVLQQLPGGDIGYLPNHRHRASDYLAAALPLGFQVRCCEEPSARDPWVDPGTAPPAAPVVYPFDIFALQRRCPAATNAVYRVNRHAIIWHFQLSQP
jgi:ubiquinone/menaquinone biosynthesis C-methylase UbiE